MKWESEVRERKGAQGKDGLILDDFLELTGPRAHGNL